MGIAAIVKPNSAELVDSTTISSCKRRFMKTKCWIAVRGAYLDCNPSEAEEIEFEQADEDLVVSIHR
jgi:hypothetical protein